MRKESETIDCPNENRVRELGRTEAESHILTNKNVVRVPPRYPFEPLIDPTIQEIYVWRLRTVTRGVTVGEQQRFRLPAKFCLMWTYQRSFRSS